MVDINPKIKELSKPKLRKWISKQEKRHTSQDWKDKLAEFKELLDAKGTGSKSKSN